MSGVSSIVAGYSISVNNTTPTAPIVGLNIVGGATYRIPYLSSTYTNASTVGALGASGSLSYNPTTSTLSAYDGHFSSLSSVTGTVVNLRTSRIYDTQNSAGTAGQLLTAGPNGGQVLWGSLPVSTFKMTNTTSCNVNPDLTRSFTYPWTGLTPTSQIIGSAVSWDFGGSGNLGGLPLYATSSITNSVVFTTAASADTATPTILQAVVMKY
jgi:hypothetical protein